MDLVLVLAVPTSMNVTMDLTIAIQMQPARTRALDSLVRAILDSQETDKTAQIWMNVYMNTNVTCMPAVITLTAVIHVNAILDSQVSHVDPLRAQGSIPYTIFLTHI